MAKETRAERIERERGEYLDEAIENDRKQVEAAQAERAPGGLNSARGADGASREGALQARSTGRAAGEGVIEDDPRLASNREEAKEKGYYGFSPTGAGENDHPMHRTGRLGSAGEFDETQPYGPAGDPNTNQ